MSSELYGNGIDWEDKFGVSFDAMSTDQKLVTMYSVLVELKKCNIKVTKAIECIPGHIAFIATCKIIFPIAFTTVITILIALVIAAFNHIQIIHVVK